jgi:isoamylase
MLLNAHHEEIPFTLPQFHDSAKWETEIDTSFDDGIRKEGKFSGGDKYPLQGRSLALLRLAK